MIKIILLVFTIVLFVSAAFFFLKSMCHFYYMNTDVKSKNHDLSKNLIPLLALTGVSYSEQGKKHLIMFRKNLLLFLINALMISVIYFVIELK